MVRGIDSSLVCVRIRLLIHHTHRCVSVSAPRDGASVTNWGGACIGLVSPCIGIAH